MKRKIGAVLAALGVVVALFVATAPEAFGSTTQYANDACYFSPYTLHVTLKVVHNDDGSYNQGVSGYIIDYYGNKIQAQGPSEWLGDWNTYLRRGAMDWTRFYGPVEIWPNGTSYQWTGRDFINTDESCDTSLTM